MAIAIADRVRIRELQHAYARAATVRAADAQAEIVLRNGRDAANTLRKAASAVLAEEADDPPHRAARDRAATALRDGAVAALRRFRASVGIEATDPATGAVLQPELIDRAEALVNTYLPDGNLGGLPEEGPALQIQAGLLRDALAEHRLGKPLAPNLTALLETHGAALERVQTEADELAAARDVLEAARNSADKWRRGGWHYVNYLANATAIPVDVKSIYPVAGRTRSVSSAAVDAALTEAGAPEVDDDGSG